MTSRKHVLSYWVACKACLLLPLFLYDLHGSDADVYFLPLHVCPPEINEEHMFCILFYHETDSQVLSLDAYVLKEMQVLYVPYLVFSLKYCTCSVPYNSFPH
jgi:hypothetical protein